MKIKLNVGISEEEQNKSIALLQSLLADVYVVFVQARNFHWNVVGKNFNDLHAKFLSMYELFDNTGDEIAERIRALDGTPIATMAEWLAAADLKEVSSKGLDAEGMVSVLVSDMEEVVSDMREACLEVDEATETMLGAQMVEIEKQIWMLNSFLS